LHRPTHSVGWCSAAARHPRHGWLAQLVRTSLRRGRRPLPCPHRAQKHGAVPRHPKQRAYFNIHRAAQPLDLHHCFNITVRDPNSNDLVISNVRCFAVKVVSAGRGFHRSTRSLKQLVPNLLSAGVYDESLPALCDIDLGEVGMCLGDRGHEQLAGLGGLEDSACHSCGAIAMVELA
jgi:hypothetical protein